MKKTKKDAELQICDNCKHGEFDFMLGEWGCWAKGRHIALFEDTSDCKDFKTKGEE